jgi:hypothetical protein
VHTDSSASPAATNGSAHPRCGFCHRDTHTDEACWHEYPERRPRCSYCGRVGHVRSSCCRLVPEPGPDSTGRLGGGARLAARLVATDAVTASSLRCAGPLTPILRHGGPPRAIPRPPPRPPPHRNNRTDQGTHNHRHPPSRPRREVRYGWPSLPVRDENRGMPGLPGGRETPRTSATASSRGPWPR